VNGFTINVGEDCTLEYVAINTGTASSTGLTKKRYADPVSVAEYATFRRSDRQNWNRMVYAYAGESLLLDKGKLLTTWGTLTLWYPKIPDRPTSDASYIDMPDGAAMALMFPATRARINKRLHNKVDDKDVAEARQILQQVYAAAGEQATKQELDQRTETVL
jgi:hypothetical protein